MAPLPFVVIDQDAPTADFFFSNALQIKRKSGRHESKHGSMHTNPDRYIFMSLFAMFIQKSNRTNI
jgi:hypothetical protein